MKKLLALFILPTFVFGGTYERDPLHGVWATPSSYIMSMKKMEFSKDGGKTWITFVEGNGDYDIASVPPGGVVGAFGKGRVLPPGTYTKIRVTISKYFKIKASVSDAGGGQPARTDSNNPGNATFVSDGYTLTSLGVCSTDGKEPTLQTLAIPSEATDGGGSQIAEFIGDNFRFAEDMDPFTIPVGSTKPPKMRLDFDVTDSVSFKTTGPGTAVMMVLGPIVTMTITP